MKHQLKHLILAALCLTASHSLLASANRTAYVDPFATARGNAFTATADNPSAVFYNAAGLTQTEGTEIQANVYAVSAGYEYSGAGGSATADDHFQDIPSFFAVHNFEDQPFALGIGVYAPFALGVDWGKDAPFAPVAYKTELAYVKHHLALAWDISDTLSIGFGISYDDADVSLDSTGPLGSFEGDDQTVGHSLSVLWQPNEQHSFGLNYQAATTMKFEGTQVVPTLGGPLALSAVSRLEFPESIVFGYSYRPNDKWNIEFNLDWTNWDKVNDLKITNIAGSSAVPLNWESSFIWELGATRYFDNGWHVSAGYTFVENSLPDEEFIPIVPDSDRHFFQVGVGREYEHFTWQFTYQYTYAKARKVKGNTAGFGLPDGEYDLDSQAIAFSIGYNF